MRTTIRLTESDLENARKIAEERVNADRDKVARGMGNVESHTIGAMGELAFIKYAKDNNLPIGKMAEQIVTNPTNNADFTINDRDMGMKMSMTPKPRTHLYPKRFLSDTKIIVFAWYDKENVTFDGWLYGFEIKAEREEVLPNGWSVYKIDRNRIHPMERLQRGLELEGD